MKTYFKHFIYLILLIFIDQFTKYFAKSYLKLETIILIPKVLKLQYHENNGAIWGILSGKIIFLVIITFIILTAILLVYLNMPMDKKYNYARIIIVFITAGAIGNLIDRIIYNYVIDFIYFELIDFPLFNIADSYISVSAIILILLSIFYYKDEDFKFLNSTFKYKRRKK